MKNKIIIISSFLVILALGTAFINYGKYSTSGSSCSYSSSVSENKGVKAAGDEWQTYEFMTDATSDESRSELQSSLLTLAGVKEVKVGPCCSHSKMSMVTVYYAGGETSSEVIENYVKDKKMDCSGKTGCSKENGKKNCSPNKQKSKDTKDI